MLNNLLNSTPKPQNHLLKQIREQVNLLIKSLNNLIIKLAGKSEKKP